MKIRSEEFCIIIALCHPLLFILAIDGLSRMIQEAKADRRIKGVRVSRALSITHLLFVDDIMLFGVASLCEWSIYKDIFETFCLASWMSISLGKSSFLYIKVQDHILCDMKNTFPCSFTRIDSGLKYLGYFLKPNRYGIADWGWLLQRIDQRINGWEARWLSIGVRLTLAHSVLQGLPVYWFSLRRIPATIINGVRSRLFRFIWSGKPLIRKWHLNLWQSPCWPKSRGDGGLETWSGSMWLCS